MTKDELKTERIAIIKEGKELEAQARKENRSLNEFEEAEKQDLLERKTQLESKIEELDKNEQRNIIVISEDKTEEITAEHRAIETVMKGEMNDEVRALTTNKQTGAYLVPTSISDQIIKQIHHDAKLFSRTKQYPAVVGKLEILREDNIGNAGFVGENIVIESSDFSMNKISLGQKRVGTAIELADKVANDMGLNPLKYAFGVLGRRLSRVIDKDILFGNNSATGLEGVLTLDENGIDKITTIKSASKNTMTAEELYDVVLNVKPQYSKDGIWLMHSSTFSHLLKMKDETGASLILPDKLTGAPIQKLFGNPIVFDDNMDKVEAGKTPILFANFGEGYATTVKKDLHLEHIWKDKASRDKRKHLLLLDTYIDGKISNKECFAKLKMQA
ncbi:phage major capsid protein [Bacillus cereus group sp. IBL03679]|uniref:phage major capsid protein n=1 Tax=Bacillus cereus group sp. IBL03679 TaxID=3240095 RepID=UPI003D2F55BC